MKLYLVSLVGLALVAGQSAWADARFSLGGGKTEVRVRISDRPSRVRSSSPSTYQPRSSGSTFKPYGWNEARREREREEKRWNDNFRRDFDRYDYDRYESDHFDYRSSRPTSVYLYSPPVYRSYACDVPAYAGPRERAILRENGEYKSILAQIESEKSRVKLSYESRRIGRDSYEAAIVELTYQIKIVKIEHQRRCGSLESCVSDVPVFQSYADFLAEECGRETSARPVSLGSTSTSRGGTNAGNTANVTAGPGSSVVVQQKTTATAPTSTGSLVDGVMVEPY